MNKQEIINIIKAKAADKIQYFENLIAETRASNNDTKSSMGDKYETGREMLQQEINNLQRQLNEVLNQQAVLQKITSDPSEKVQNGALVKTDKGLFYVAVSMGEIIFALDRPSAGTWENIAGTYFFNTTSYSGGAMFEVGRKLFNLLSSTPGDIRRYANVDPTSTIVPGYGVDSYDQNFYNKFNTDPRPLKF